MFHVKHLKKRVKMSKIAGKSIVSRGTMLVLYFLIVSRETILRNHSSVNVSRET